MDLHSGCLEWPRCTPPHLRYLVPPLRTGDTAAGPASGYLRWTPLRSCRVVKNTLLAQTWCRHFSGAPRSDTCASTPMPLARVHGIGQQRAYHSRFLSAFMTIGMAQTEEDATAGISLALLVDLRDYRHGANRGQRNGGHTARAFYRPQGHEIARHPGETRWDRPQTVDLLRFQINRFATRRSQSLQAQVRL